MASYNFSDLKNKTVIIVGGFGLIGKELCRAFCDNEVNLVIADLVENDQFIKELKKLYPAAKISFHTFNITEEKDIDVLIKNVIKEFKKIDIFVNSAWPRTKDWGDNVEKVKYSSIKKNLVDQLGSYYNCTQKIALQMKKQKSGSIINFSSIYGKVAPTFSLYEGTEMTSPPAYALIKGGVNMMTKYFASYFGKYNVRINCVSPGGVYRDENPRFVENYKKMVPLGRMANPEDLAMPVLFLASDGSRYVTGHNLLVDGGWTIH